MSIVKAANTMYRENIYMPDAFKGCFHNCVYCKPSFQRQSKRQRQRCKVLNEKGIPKCYSFEPHFHPERLKRKAPATHGKEFVFFPKGGDLAFASPPVIMEMLDYVKRNPQTTFLFGQTKAPEYLRNYPFPENVILAITLETDKRIYYTPSLFVNYERISKALIPFFRAFDFRDVHHDRKAVIIEPILQFNLSTFVAWIFQIKPEFVYVGYDTKNCHLPEPTLKETEQLIKALENAGIEVRLKTIRKAWYETEESMVGLTKC